MSFEFQFNPINMAHVMDKAAAQREHRPAERTAAPARRSRTSLLAPMLELRADLLTVWDPRLR